MKTSVISSKPANNLHYILHLRILTWPLAPSRKSLVCSKWPIHCAESQSSQKFSQMHNLSVPWGKAVCVPLCALKRVKRAFHILECLTRGPSRPFRSPRHCFLPSSHLNMGSQHFTHNLEVALFCLHDIFSQAFTCTSLAQALERHAGGMNTTHLTLDTHYWLTSGMGAHIMNTFPKGTGNKAYLVAYKPHANVWCLLVVGINPDTFCQLKKSIPNEEKEKETEQTMAIETLEECND